MSRGRFWNLSPCHFGGTGVDPGTEHDIVGAEELLVNSNLGEGKLCEAVLQRVAGVLSEIFERVDTLVFSSHEELSAILRRSHQVGCAGLVIGDSGSTFIVAVDCIRTSVVENLGLSWGSNDSLASNSVPVPEAELLSVPDLLHNDSASGDEVGGNIKSHVEAHDVVAVDGINDLIADVHGLLDSATDGCAISLVDRDRVGGLELALNLHLKLGRRLRRSVLDVPVLGIEIKDNNVLTVACIDVANAGLDGEPAESGRVVMLLSAGSIRGGGINLRSLPFLFDEAGLTGIAFGIHAFSSGSVPFAIRIGELPRAVANAMLLKLGIVHGLDVNHV